MTWTAPHVTRTDGPLVGDERAIVEAFLDFHRQTLLMKCAGLTADQLKIRAVEPSSLSLLGLVRHLAEVERSWFRQTIGGEQVELIYCSDTNPDGDFDDVDDADAEADFATLAAEIEAARGAVQNRTLDETVVRRRSGDVMAIRVIYLHMIEEYARHNGHADLLRERIDGTTGE